MKHPVIWVKQGVTRHPQYRLAEPVDFSLEEGEQLAIVGPNASGKSLLVGILTGRYPLLMNEVSYDFGEEETRMVSECVRYITFRDSYGDADGGYYYQQRWNSQDLDDTPIVADLLPPCKDEQLRKALYDLFGIEEMLSKHIILLSSGELRKFQLTKTLLSGPRVLIMDNPFIGLDAQTREQLAGLLQTLIRETDLQVILVLSKTDDIPEFITHVIPVEHLDILPKVPRTEYVGQRPRIPVRVLEEDKAARILALPEKENRLTTTDTEGCMLRFNHVSIRYGHAPS